METKKILIAEDHSTVRMGLKVLLTEMFSQVDIHFAISFQETIKLVESTQYDLIILDINIEGGNNVKMISSIREFWPQQIVLVYSGYDEQLYALHYIQAGANGFLSKNASDEEHKIAIYSVLNSGKYISNVVQERLLSKVFEKKSPDPFEHLSSRETQIMLMLAEGKWTKEIATTLNLKLSTISTFKARIFEKLNVTNSVELAKKLELHRQNDQP